MARCDDDGWLFIGCVGVVVGMLVSDMSSEAEVEKELVKSISISVASGSLTSLVHVDSTYSRVIWILVEAICGSGDCCWGLSKATSSIVTLEALCSSDVTSGSSLE